MLEGTLEKHTMPTHQPNFAKEPFNPSHFNPRIKSLQIERKMNENKKGQLVVE